MERTLSILKPDATRRNITGAVNKIIEDNGFRIVAQKRVLLTQKQVAAFYDAHKEKSFFKDMLGLMTAGPVVVQVLEKDNAISDYRRVMGATNPANADEGTIRKQFGESIDCNTVHGSDSPESAASEIHFFFSDSEISG